MKEWELVEMLNEFNLQPSSNNGHAHLCAIVVVPALHREILLAQGFEQDCEFIRFQIAAGKALTEWTIHTDNSLRFKGLIFVPNIGTLREAVLREFHHSNFVVHSGGTKMYHDLQRTYWWEGMKKDVANFVSTCLVGQQVKAEHQKPGGISNPY